MSTRRNWPLTTTDADKAREAQRRLDEAVYQRVFTGHTPTIWWGWSRPLRNWREQ